MRITAVPFVDGFQDRGERLAPWAALLPTWRKAETKEEAPPVPEPDKGLHFDVRI